MRGKINGKSLIFQAIICIAIIFSYSLIVKNSFNLDDTVVLHNNEIVKQGIKGVPKAFSAHYSNSPQVKVHYAYRPLAIATFAFLYEFFEMSAKKYHVVSVVLYLVFCLILFQFLRRTLTSVPIEFIFFAVLLFAVHPIQTELVCSIKNLDQMLSQIFVFLGLLVLTIVNAGSKRSIILSIFFSSALFFIAFLFKGNIHWLFLIIPLVLYYKFPNAIKQLAILALVPLISFALFKVFKEVSLEAATNRPREYLETPLYINDGILERFSLGLKGLLKYFELMFFPIRMSAFYGTGAIPHKPLFDFNVVLSLLIHLGLLGFGLKELIKKKSLLGFSILFYLGGIAMYSNFLKPGPGIIADRWASIACIGFCLAVVSLAFLLRDKIKPKNWQKQIPLVLLSVLAITFAFLSFKRVPLWKNQTKLYTHNLKYYPNSLKLHRLLGREHQIAFLALPTNEQTFQHTTFKKAIKSFETVDANYPSDMKNNKNKLDLALLYFWVRQFDEALPHLEMLYQDDFGGIDVLYGLGNSNFFKGNAKEALKYYNEAIEKYPNVSFETYFRRAFCYAEVGRPELGLESAKRGLSMNPKSVQNLSLMADYYLFTKDTTGAITIMNKALEFADPATQKFINDKLKQLNR